jgi:hypothetical protein
MADEAGPFNGTLCAYNTNNALLGCIVFSGIGGSFAGGTNGFATFTGIYDDTAEIAKVVVDAGGVLYPLDFAISNLHVASVRRMVPPNDKDPSGFNRRHFPREHGHRKCRHKRDRNRKLQFNPNGYIHQHPLRLVPEHFGHDQSVQQRQWRNTYFKRGSQCHHDCRRVWELQLQRPPQRQLHGDAE